MTATGPAPSDTDPTGTGPTYTGPTYTEAIDELDAILRELDGADVDVDHLAARVGRAAELIALCREKIRVARVHVETVTADLDAAARREDP